MTEHQEEGGVLSREELDALLESLSGEGLASPDWRPPPRGRVLQAALQRANEAFALEQSRYLSNVHQCLIKFSLIGSREIERAELAELILPSDRVAAFSLEPSGATGCLVMGRPLVFNVMGLDFGARAGTKRQPVPTRPYTRIEMRFLGRLARRILENLTRAWSSIVPLESRFLSLQGREWIEESGKDPVTLATFDVSGFGEVCRIRVAIPSAPFADLDAMARAAAREEESPLEQSVLEMPIRLSVEASAANLPLGELQRLRVGETFELPARDSEGLVVRVAGKPKFRGTRGSVGRRVAVQLTGWL